MTTTVVALTRKFRHSAALKRFMSDHTEANLADVMRTYRAAMEEAENDVATVAEMADSLEATLRGLYGLDGAGAG